MTPDLSAYDTLIGIISKGKSVSSRGQFDSEIIVTRKKRDMYKNERQNEEPFFWDCNTPSKIS